MPQYTVLYAKSLPDPFQTPDVFEAADYLEMGTFETDGLDQLYSRLQDPDDLAFKDRCAAAPIHTSMTAGDVVINEAGERWMCDAVGWKRLL